MAARATLQTKELTTRPMLEKRWQIPEIYHKRDYNGEQQLDDLAAQILGCFSCERCWAKICAVTSPTANFQRKLSGETVCHPTTPKSTPFSRFSKLCHIFFVLVGRVDDLTKNHSVIKTNFGSWPVKSCCNADHFDVFVTSAYFPIRYMGVCLLLCLLSTPVSIVAYSALLAFSML